MFDTVILNLPTLDGAESLHRLDSVRELFHRQTGQAYWRGTLGNLRVDVTAGHLRITGSLPKFVMGNNVENLSRRQVRDGILLLEDRLAQPLGLADVWRLDIAHTFDVTSPACEYWRCLLPPSRMRSMEYRGESLTFYNRTRSILFYDKRIESPHRDDLREKTAGSPAGHLLRFEVQLKKRIKKSFQETVITASKLSSEAFFLKAVRLWEQQYFSIPRTQQLAIHEPHGSSVKSFVHSLASIGIESTGGVAGIVARIKANQRSGLLSDVQAKRIRDRVIQLAADDSCTTPSEPLSELDAKVRGVRRSIEIADPLPPAFHPQHVIPGALGASQRFIADGPG